MRAKIEVAREAILAAGVLLKETFGRELNGEVEQKNINDFVTETDKLSEKLITGTLKMAYPEIGVLAEESEEALEDETFWIIDPLDGTTNFIHGYPSIGVSIALMEQRQVVLGLVYDPLREELFEAIRGEGAYRNEKQISVSGAQTLAESLLGTGFPFRVHEHIDSYLEVFRELFVHCRGIRRAGAAVLDLSHVAAGRLDGFWELYLKPWDMAAGSLMIEEAGGLVSDFFGGPDYLSSGHIIAASPSIYNSILETVGRHFRKQDLEGLATRFMI